MLLSHNLYKMLKKIFFFQHDAKQSIMHGNIIIESINKLILQKWILSLEYINLKNAFIEVKPAT